MPKNVNSCNVNDYRRTSKWKYKKLLENHRNRFRMLPNDEEQGPNIGINVPQIDQNDSDSDGENQVNTLDDTYGTSSLATSNTGDVHEMGNNQQEIDSNYRGDNNSEMEQEDCYSSDNENIFNRDDINSGSNDHDDDIDFDDDEDADDRHLAHDDSSTDETIDEIEDDNDAVDDEMIDDDEADQPLYPGATITLAESLLSIFTMSVACNLNGLAFAKLLKLIDLLLPPGSNFKKTTYQFMKFFETVENPMEKHFYCSNCREPLENENAVCECSSSSDKKDNCYFLSLSIVDQLEKIISKPGITTSLSHPFARLKNDPNAINDIYDGRLYKEYMKKNDSNVDKYNLSFMWYTDGAPVFKSKRYSLWPLYLIINELPFNERIKKENIVLAGIWFGTEDINSDLILMPIYEHLEELKNGVEIETPEGIKIVRAILLAGTCDAPAKADIMNIKRFNGRYGCPRCLHPGSNVSGVDFGNTHVYKYQENIELRSKEQHSQHATDAVSSKSPQFGVVGPTIMNAVMPDMIRGISTDIMHCGYLGGIKKTSELWLSSEHRFKNFSLYQSRQLIDLRLTKIKPPAMINRLPREISLHFKYFKASEFKNWFFYYSPVILCDIFAEKKEYFDHHLQLVLALYILNQPSIMPNEIDISRHLLHSYVSKYENLYAERFMSFNLHCLLHLPDVVLDLGPLWVTSCFLYEDLLGKTLKYVHGTRYVGLQVYSKVIKNIIAHEKVKRLPRESAAKDFCKEMMTYGKRYDNKRKILSGTYILGKLMRFKQLDIATIRALESIAYNVEDQQNIKISFFYRIKRYKFIIHARNYRRGTLKISHCIVVKNDWNETEIGYAEKFLKACNCVENTNCGYFCADAEYYVLFRRLDLESPFEVPYLENENLDEPDVHITLPYIHKVRGESEHCKLIAISNVVNMCFVMNVDNSVYVAEIINSGEYDQ